jgi:hypothetical protein
MQYFYVCIRTTFYLVLVDSREAPSACVNCNKSTVVIESVRPTISWQQRRAFHPPLSIGGSPPRMIVYVSPPLAWKIFPPPPDSNRRQSASASPHVEGPAAAQQVLRAVRKKSCSTSVAMLCMSKELLYMCASTKFHFMM